MLHEVTAGIINNHMMRHAVLAQLPGGQKRTLVARPGFIDPDMDVQPGIKGLVNRRRGSAPINRGEPTGIAMGQNIDRLVSALLRRNRADQFQSMITNARVLCHSLIADICGHGIGRPGALLWRQRRQCGLHLVQRPAQIHRRGPGRQKRCIRLFQRCIGWVGAHAQRQPVRSRRPDQRRAAHMHVGNGFGGIINSAQNHGFKMERKARLIKNTHRPAIIIEPDCAIGNAINIHVLPLSFSRL